MRDTEGEREAETQAEREGGSTREPYVGLDPGTPGSHPGLKAGAQALSHPGVPIFDFYNQEMPHLVNTVQGCCPTSCNTKDIPPQQRIIQSKMSVAPR